MKLQRNLLAAAVALATFVVPAAVADDGEEANLGQKVFYYFPNRVLDFLDIFQVGMAFGPGFGGEVALTDKYQIGKYKTNESGIGWYGSNAGRKLRRHQGKYETKVKGGVEKRKETTLDDGSRFYRGASIRGEKEVRAQAALGLVHPFVGVDGGQITDFVTGLIAFDLRDDDMKPERYSDGDPGRKLGRGVSNIATGLLEIPKSIHVVNQEHGGVAALTWGTVRGLQRTVVREATGVYEVFTFPDGREAIIDPEFPFQPKHTDVEWRVRWD